MAKKKDEAPEAAATEQKSPDAKPEAKADKAEKAEGKAKPEKAKGKPAAKPAPSKAAPEATQKKRRPGKSPRRGKKLRNQMKSTYQKVRGAGTLPLIDAVKMLKQIKRAKFDETVEVHMNLGIDPTQSDQMIRGSVSLPHGVGKSVRVIVFCQADNVQKALDAGADFAGSDDLIQKIQKDGWTDFDVAIATQDMMAQVSRLGRVLGPRGLMPSPKAGTVIRADQDIAQAVTEFKAGKVEYRSDRTGNVHVGAGKMSFEAEQLAENITAFVNQIRNVKPSGVKGHYIRGITIAGTMTPGIPVAM